MDTNPSCPDDLNAVSNVKMALKAEYHEFPSLTKLRSLIPAHCFEPSTVMSLSYLARDITLSMLLGAAAMQIPMLSSFTARTALWVLYGMLQGIVFTGLWIIAHECGHGSFLKSKVAANTIGCTVHSLLLVPYFSWKFSHSRHHRFANHITRDVAFVPETEASLSPSKPHDHEHDDKSDVPIVTLCRMIMHQLFGWPLYLLSNITAGSQSLAPGKRSSWLSDNHFDPTCGVFTWKEAPYVFVSDLGVLMTVYALSVLSFQCGWQTTCLLYLQPWLWVNHWIVAITYLHHTHPELPHYDATAWTFTKGALSTVDRDCGVIGRQFFHHITDTHVVHHLFPRIPFYHAVEATAAIKPLLGEKYHEESGSFMLDFWRTFRYCHFVKANPSNSGVLEWNWTGK